MDTLASNCNWKKNKQNKKAYPERVRSQICIFYFKTGLKMICLTKRWAQNLSKGRIHIRQKNRREFEMHLYLWRAGTTPILKKDAPRIWAEILASNEFQESLRELLREYGFHINRLWLPFQELLREYPGIPRVAPRMAFSLRERLFF